MKKQILGFLLGVLILPLGAMAQDHSGHNMNHDKEVITHYKVSTEFQKQLNAVYQVSLEINEALVADKTTETKELAAKMTKKMSLVDMSLLKGDAHMAWMTYMKLINEGLNKIKLTNDLKEQRTAYKGVAEGLFKSVKSFGVGETVYYQYCGMAKGSWLNDSKDINNPYYGSRMLKCGSTKEVLN